MNDRPRKQPQGRNSTAGFVENFSTLQSTRTTPREVHAAVVRHNRMVKAQAAARAAQRLKGLKAASLPWLSNDVDLTPPRWRSGNLRSCRVQAAEKPRLSKPE